MIKKILPGVFSALGILLLILDSKTALAGARDGIELCLISVIPSIFPFLVLTGILTPAIFGARIPVLRPLSRILGIPAGSEGIFLTGIMGGYPTGAQAVHQAWRQGQLNNEDAKRMLAFCSNAGPSFLFGILGTRFPEIWMPWLLWGIHIVSAVAVAVLMPGKNSTPYTNCPPTSVTLTDSLKKAVATMGCICGWVVVFRVMLAFLDRWLLWLFPLELRVGIYALFELANGCCKVDLIASDGLRFILCSGMLAFGGICVAMQTASVTGELGMGKYVQGKLLQAMISIILSAIAQYFLFSPTEKVALSPVFVAILMLFAAVTTIICLKSKNRASILTPVGV